MPPKRRADETSGAEAKKRKSWTPAEESQLRTLVAELGPGAWPAIAQRLGTGRSATAVDQHWRKSAASAPSAAPKPAKRARKSAAKRAAKSAAKPVATGDSLAALPPPEAAKRVPPPGTRVAVRFDDEDYDGTVGDALDDGRSATVKFDDGSEHPIDFTESGIRITREAPAAAPPPAAKPAAKAKPRAPPAAKKPQSKPAPRPPRAAPTPAAAPKKPAAKKPRPAPPAAAPAPAPAAKKPRPAPTEDEPPAADDVDELIARNAPIARTEKPRGGRGRPASIEAATTVREYLEGGGEISELKYDLKNGFFRFGEEPTPAAPQAALQVGASGFRNVQKPRTPGGVWSTSVRIEGSRTSAGSHTTKEDAARAVDALLLAHGKPAVNFPGEEDASRAAFPDITASPRPKAKPRVGTPSRKRPPPPAAEEAPPPPDEPAIEPRLSFPLTNISTGQFQEGEPDDDLPTSSAKTRKRNVFGDLGKTVGSEALGRMRALIRSVRGASSKLKDSTLKTLRNRRNTSRKGLSSKTLRSRIAELTAKAQKQAMHPLVHQQGDGDDCEFDDSITDLVQSQIAAKSEKAVADDFHKALDALRKPDRTAEGTTTAKGVAFLVDGEALREDGSSNEEGVDADAWGICLLACADHFGRLARDFPQQSIHEAVVSAISQTNPCESAIAKLLTAETYAIIKRLVARVEARCPKNKRGYKLAWAAFAGAARHAAHHGEELVLYRLLSALDGRSAKITIVSFGHPACDDCFCLLSLLGDVEESTAVPAALCPSGLNYRDVGVACGVSTMDW